MSSRQLRWLGIVAPTLFWVLIIAIRAWWAPGDVSYLEIFFELIMLVVGCALFSSWVSNRFDRHDAEMLRRTEQLEALREATLSLTSELELSVVLQRVVDLSRDLADARYAALGVLDASGKRLEHFITSGMNPEQRGRMAEQPSGRGLLGAVIEEGRALRVDDIAADPRSIGFPLNHPPMRTFLGAPIISRGRVFGNLYLTDKISTLPGERSAAFTDQDLQTLEMFAAHAAVAIENAQLSVQNRQIAVMQERERFGMNLHDGIIQSIYALGLMLDDASHRVVNEPAVARERMAKAIKGLNDVIHDIRNYIKDLQPTRYASHNVQQGIEEIVRSLRSSAPLDVRIDIDPGAVAVATRVQSSELLLVAQEALTNIHKHAQATGVDLRLERRDGDLCLIIIDNGRGFDVMRAALSGNGNGLRNMQERASVLHGDFEIQSKPGAGTRIILSIPIVTGAS